MLFACLPRLLGIFRSELRGSEWQLGRVRELLLLPLVLSLSSNRLAYSGTLFTERTDFFRLKDPDR